MDVHYLRWLCILLTVLSSCAVSRDADKANYARYRWEFYHGFSWEVKAAHVRGQTVRKFRSGYDWMLVAPDYDEWLSMECNRTHIIVDPPTGKARLLQDLDRLRHEIDSQKSLIDTIYMMVTKFNTDTIKK